LSDLVGYSGFSEDSLEILSLFQRPRASINIDFFLDDLLPDLFTGYSQSYPHGFFITYPYILITKGYIRLYTGFSVLFQYKLVAVILSSYYFIDFMWSIQ